MYVYVMFFSYIANVSVSKIVANRGDFKNINPDVYTAFVDFDIEMMVKLLRSNQEILRKVTLDVVQFLWRVYGAS